MASLLDEKILNTLFIQVYGGQSENYIARLLNALMGCGHVLSISVFVLSITSANTRDKSVSSVFSNIEHPVQNSYLRFKDLF